MSRPRSSLAFALALSVCLVATPVSGAASAVMTLGTDAQILIDGAVDVCIDQGAAMIRSFQARGVWTLEAAAARLELIEARQPGVTVTNVDFNTKASPERTPYAVDDGQIAIEAADEYLSIVLEPVGGRICVSGNGAGNGKPVRLEQEVDRHIPPAPPSSRWERGWWFVGSYPAQEQIEGYPTLASASIRVEGAVHMKAYGGNITFRSGGENITERLGDYYERDGSATVADVSAGYQVARAIMLEGNLDATDLEVTDAWGLASPTMTWSIEGTVAWPHASGSAIFDGVEHSFEDVQVQAVGAILLAPTQPPLVEEKILYRAQGDLETLTIDGAVLESTSVVRAGPAAQSGIFALVLAVLAWLGRELLTRAFIGAYTRLTPSDALSHPTRTRIADQVRARPGILAGELHDLVGGAWGPFRFHLRVLESFGIVRLERRGRYTVVLPMVAAAGLPIIPHETQRRVFEALPPDGAPVSVRDLTSKTGLTRQLVNYHLGALSQAGLVARAGTVLGPRLVRRQLSALGPQQARR